MRDRTQERARECTRALTRLMAELMCVYNFFTAKDDDERISGERAKARASGRAHADSLDG